MGRTIVLFIFFFCGGGGPKVLKKNTQVSEYEEEKIEQRKKRETRKEKEAQFQLPACAASVQLGDGPLCFFICLFCNELWGHSDGLIRYWALLGRLVVEANGLHPLGVCFWSLMLHGSNCLSSFNNKNNNNNSTVPSAQMARRGIMQLFYFLC